MGIQAVFFTNFQKRSIRLNCGEYVGRNSSSVFKVLRGVLHEVAALVARVVQNDRDGHGQVPCRQSVQQPADVLAVDVSVGGDGDEFMVTAFSAPKTLVAVDHWGGLPAARHAPDPTQE